ncbi:AfsR/SARP family transcriptional regulator [Micromonospora sp. RP3T]|uniref:AfsR/SARP family transcriptional regulator n=1 Tax=Micromonospora sp. RP3T TaxID=2135446 RepID=UPI003D738D8A
MVLAALAIDAGRPLQPEVLIDRVWAQALPLRARRILHVYVARIRKVLAAASDLSGCPATLTHRSGGYVLEVDPDAVDAHRFQSLVVAAAATTPNMTATRRALLLMALLRSSWLSSDRCGSSVRRMRLRCRTAGGHQRRRPESTDSFRALKRPGHRLSQALPGGPRRPSAPVHTARP